MSRSHLAVANVCAETRRVREPSRAGPCRAEAECHKIARGTHWQTPKPPEAETRAELDYIPHSIRWTSETRAEAEAEPQRVKLKRRVYRVTSTYAKEVESIRVYFQRS